MLRRHLMGFIALFMFFIGIFCGGVVAADKPGQIINTMKHVADWQLAHLQHKDTDWQNAAFYAGVFALYNTTKDEKYLNALTKMGERNQWQLGSRPRHADDHCIGQTYLSIYRLKRDPSMIAEVKRTMDRIATDPRPGREEWWWCDALFMAPPLMAGLTETTGDQSYIRIMDRMWWDATAHLFDTESALFFRDDRFFDIVEKNGEKVFWSRGNGWVMAGLVRVLQSMSDDFPGRQKYIALFRKMAQRVTSLQSDDGFWRPSLLDPESFPTGESSGTGFFTYALAWGINSGLLPAEQYLPTIWRGWNALVDSVEDSGKLGWAQPASDRPQRVKREDSAPYGAGAFLLAGSEMVKTDWRSNGVGS